MALDTEVRFSATILDAMGVTATSVAYLQADSTGTGASLVGAAQTWATDLDAVTAGKITELRVTILAALPGGLKANPVAGSEVEKTGVLNFTADESPHRFGFIIPAIKAGAIAAGRIDLSNADVRALVNLLTAATGTTQYANAANQIITGFADALLSFRKHRKQLARKSFETGPLP